MNQRQLVRRDPALAAAMGLSGSDFGADFGGMDDFGDDYYGADFGTPVSAHHPALAHRPAAPHPAQLSPQQMAHLAQRHIHAQALRRHRELLLDPNQGSDLKVEGYSFVVNIKDDTTGADPKFGTAGGVSGENTPDVFIRPESIFINVISPGQLTVSLIKVGNITGTIGGQGDAFIYNANGVGRRMSLPGISQSTKASFSGSWTGLVVPPFNGGDSFALNMTLMGPATMAPAALR